MPDNVHTDSVVTRIQDHLKGLVLADGITAELEKGICNCGEDLLFILITKKGKSFKLLLAHMPITEEKLTKLIEKLTTERIERNYADYSKSGRFEIVSVGLFVVAQEWDATDTDFLTFG